MAAVKKGNLFSLLLFLLSSCAPKGQNIDQQLMKALLDGDSDKIESTLKKDVKDDDQALSFKRIAFLRACKEGDINRVKDFLDKKVDVNTIDAMGKSALYHACDGGNLGVVKFLLDKGADINGNSEEHSSLGVPKFTWSPLKIACIKSSEDIALLLIERGAFVRASDGLSPLFEASSYRLRKVVQALIAKGANVNSRDLYGNTPLLYSALFTPLGIKNSVAVADLLIANGADVNAKNNDNISYADLVKVKK